LKTIGEIDFRFADKGQPMSYAIRLENRLHYFDDKDIPNIIKQAYIVEEFDKARI
jgi:hypothetical protein